MTGHPTGSDPTRDEEVGRLQKEIEETREGMSHTVQALETRLNPSEVADRVGAELKRVVQAELQEAKGLLREEMNEAEDKLKRGLGEARNAVKADVKQAFDGAKSALRAATVGQVEDLASSIGDKMNQARDTLMNTVRSNPIPASLVGVGVVWLLMNRSKTASNAAHQASAGVGRGVQHATDAVEGIAHSAVALGHRAEGAASHLAHQASDAASSAVDGAKRGARRVEEGLRSNLHENPLAIGAAALAIGAVVGYSLPRTEREDALMGDARDRMMHLAGEAAEHGASSVAKLADKALTGAKASADGPSEAESAQG